MFALLADPAQPFLKQMPWDKMDLYWVDERCVSPDDAESNYRMTNEALLSKVPLPAERIHRMEGELDPEVAAARYESTIRNTFKLEGAETPTFDLVLLGMGDDGHTASLFPHTEALNELSRIAVRQSRSAEGYVAHHADVAGDQSGQGGGFSDRRRGQSAGAARCLARAVSAGDLSVADHSSGKRAADTLARCGCSG